MKLPEFKSKIDFVKYFEFEYLKSKLTSLKNKDKIYKLKAYKEGITKIKLPVLSIVKKNTIADRLYKIAPTKLISSIAYFQDYIFCGNSVGQIRMFTCEKQHDIDKTFSNKEIEGSNSVTSISISSDGDYFVAGYSNGYLILWETATTKCKKIINDLHKKCILDCKLLVSTKKI